MIRLLRRGVLGRLAGGWRLCPPLHPATHAGRPALDDPVLAPSGPRRPSRRRPQQSSPGPPSASDGPLDKPSPLLVARPPGRSLLVSKADLRPGTTPSLRRKARSAVVPIPFPALGRTHLDRHQSRRAFSLRLTRQFVRSRAFSPAGC